MTHVADADEREFDVFAAGQDPLDLLAATWAVRRRDGLDAEGEAALQAWLASDPRHAAAFEDMDATFGEVQHLPDDDVAALKAGLRAPPSATDATTAQAALADVVPRALPSAAGRAPRSWLDSWLDLQFLFPRLAAAAMLLLVLGGGWIGWRYWWQLPVHEQTYATARGQQLGVSLPDAHGNADGEGSRLHLDTATRTEVRLYRDRREVLLQDGQALFAVHRDAQRPFHVRAGSLRITVLGTRFSVRHTRTGLEAGRTVVSVEEGRVRVTRVAHERVNEGDVADDPATDDAGSGSSLELVAGQMVVADDAGNLGAVASIPSGAIAPWHKGRLSFDQTPLAEAIAEFERYGATGLVVRDPAVAALPVGGSYSLRQFQHFADTLPQVLPVRMVKRSGSTEVVSR
ncbi:MAG: FecR domain-containing protein [Moraxellaceae bacterium]|nr:FecR domain-containing protein [Moraxellaceae bacterium]